VIRVVVVDDHEVVRQGLTSLLGSAEDIECVGTAGDGVSALDLVGDVDPDVVVLDLSMPPGMDGVAVLRALRARGDRARVLVLTSYGDSGRVMDAVLAGADGYLLKQNEAERIIDGVRSVAAGRSPVDPAVAPWLLSSVRDTSQADLLTEREREVLDLVRMGQPNKSIARRLQISERTVKGHVTRIFQRIGVTDRTQAALWAQRHLPAVPSRYATAPRAAGRT
jgi:DNA-binding NarL/FixJ family response regulator